jgi:hypothetical protein
MVVGGSEGVSGAGSASTAWLSQLSAQAVALLKVFNISHNFRMKPGELGAFDHLKIISFLLFPLLG